MRTLRAARRTVLATGILVVSAGLTPTRAVASCYYNGPNNVFAVTGDVCDAVAAAYVTQHTVSPPPPPPPPGFPSYTGFALLGFDGGVIDATASSLSISTTHSGFNNAYGVWSDGSGSNIDLSGVQVLVTTSGGTSYGLFASGGGVISSAANEAVETTGAGSAAVEAKSGGGD